MGGAMDLVSAPGAQVIVVMEHVNKNGEPKILPSCKLPLTGKNVVTRLITDMAVFDVCRKNGLTLIEVRKDLNIDDIKKATAAPFKMPLLNKKPFDKAEVPSVKSDEKIFFLEATNEIFFNYDEFFERTIQLNSTVWTCEYTGRGGLTYFEAVESEKEAIKSLGDFPVYLERPILFLVHKYTKRGRFDDLLNDIYAFMKTRFFLGEECQFQETNTYKKVNVKISKIHLIREWTAPPDANPKEPIACPGELYRYDVTLLDGQCMTMRENIPPGCLIRSKASSSKAKLKLFLKNSTFISDERFEVKKRHLEDGVIESLKWEDILMGPEPVFPASTQIAKRGRPSLGSSHSLSVVHSNGHSLDSSINSESSPEKSPKKGKPISEKKQQKINAQREELASTFEKARKFGVDISKYESALKVLSSEEIAKLKDEIKFARDAYNEKVKEERKQKIKQRYEYNKKREDLEVDDLKPLPEYSPVPLPSWVTDDDFGDFLSILQFFNTFAELLPLKEVRGKSKVYLSDIINAIRCNDPQKSAYADMMKVLLTVRTDIGDEEDGDEADVTSREEIQLMNIQQCDPSHPRYGQKIKEITEVHEDIRKIHGMSVRHLPVDWMTLTEAIRLILLTSGYYTGVSTHRHRIFGRGYYKGFEDAGFVFRHKYPETMERLKTMSVFDLEPKERLELMKVAIDQLLSFAKEAKEARLIREHESEEAAKEGRKPDPLEVSKEMSKFKTQMRNYRESARSGKEDFEEKLMGEVAFKELEMEEICTARELQRQKVKQIEKEQLEVIYELSAVSGLYHLGRDRAYRNYFACYTLPGILVENPIEFDYIGECIEKTPFADWSAYNSLDEARNAAMACTGDMETCTVHGKRKNERTRWMHIESREIFEQALKSLNKRGIRELALFEEMTYYKPWIEDVLEKIEKKIERNDWPTIFMADGQEDPNELTNIDFHVEMRDLLLDLEDKLQQGLIGFLDSSIDRQEWRRLLSETGDITSLIKGDIVVKTKEEEEIIYSHDELGRLNPVQKLAIAFLQLVQTIQMRFFRPPFVQPSREDSSVNRLTNTFVRWQKSLLQCDSICAIALFLGTLEPAIMWDKSRLQGKCRLCRKKGAAESLVLCTNCDKCFHLGCVHLDAPAPTDWSCSECNAEKRKKAAIEKRKATRAVALAEQMSKMEDESEGDENSMQTSDKNRKSAGAERTTTNGHSKESTEMVQTSSGRSVKKVVYKEMSGGLSPQLAKPLRTSKRNSLPARTKPKYEEDIDYSESDSANETPTRMSTRRKRKASEELIIPSYGRAAIAETYKEKMAQLEKLVHDVRREEFSWPFLEAVDTKEVSLNFF
ncbi:hypothetical protein WR25_02425 isoform E [Diploscapter pachys]|nr:hypothetical protein WR25_02425 isoform C [Diploscapter pachys]PAV74428.1 hypothetical protein WR25_02425 isoform E [Diploscapter pachys]